MSVAEKAPELERLAISQRVDLRAMLGLSLRNGLLNLVTLTLYRFWGKTEVRRRIWASTYLNEEPFEYTGRGKELFLGFLFALAVVALPFLVAVFGAQFLGPAVAVAVIFPLYLFLFFLLGFGRFTAFRYMASRTSWRGVRLRLTGSAVRYGFRWLGYVLLSAVTLGWFWPAAERRLSAPLWDGLRFGDRRFRFDLERARQEKVYGAYVIGWLGSIAGYILLMGFVFAEVARQGEAPAEPSAGLIALIYLFTGLAALGYAVVFAPYHAAMLRSVCAGVGLDDAAQGSGARGPWAGANFRLRLRWTEMAGLSVSNLLLVTFTLGFLMPFVQARTTRFLVNRLECDGAVDFSTIRQAADGGPRTGEGLADAFGLAPL